MSLGALNLGWLELHHRAQLDLTLAAATLGRVQVPQAPVEGFVALSILFVAVEVLHEGKGQRGLAARKPWLVAFVFGLLHSLAFAVALREVGLPERAIPLALAFFNIGVDAGQLLFIAAFFALVWGSAKLFLAPPATNRSRATPASWSQTARLALPCAYVIGTLASSWLIERAVGFWS
jgi:hypothetical protein